MAVNSSDSNVNPYSLLKKVLSDALGSGTAMGNFYELFYRKDFHPDVNGYNMIFIQPPDFSGWRIGPHAGQKSALPVYISELAPLLATAFAPPQTQVTTDNVSAKFGAVPFATSVESTGQLNITYMDNQHLHVFGYHKLWQDYIRDVLQGDVNPNPDYLRMGTVVDDYCEVDYMAAAYTVRFRPSIGFANNDDFYKNIVYIGKATGIFPITIPDTEIIGRRDSPQMTIVPISYSCANYRRHSPQLGFDDGFSYIMKDFKKLIR